MNELQYIPEIDSTNTALSVRARQENLPDGFTLYTYRQTHGRGQKGNRWESEPEANLLFSVLWNELQVAVNEQFIISQVVALAVRNVAARYADGVTIKWPNDIYCHDRKLAGILIENVLESTFIRQAVLGVGLNVNQTVFPEYLPNPVSLAQLTGRAHDKLELLQEILAEMARLRELALGTPAALRDMYFEHLYRAAGFYPFRAGATVFEAEIADVRPDGTLHLRLRDGQIRQFLFKEVEFVL